jgi:ligand-binding sensor domain-containing protein/serine phosphatase RsbU (regulator of sigma subunit)
LKRFTPNIYIILFLLVISNQLNSQSYTQAGKEYNFTHYSNEDGLFQKSILNLYQDSKGLIWICSNEGLVRFDGINFKRFTKKNGLLSTAVGSIVEDDNNAYWISTMGGFYFYEKGKFTRFDSTSGIHKSFAWCLFKDKDGSLWAGTSDGVLHLNPNQPKNPLIKKYNLSGISKAVRFISRNKNDELIVGSEHGYYKLNKDSLFLHNTTGGPAYAIIEFGNDKEVFSGWGSELYQYKNGKHDSIINLGSFILDMTKDHDGNIWMASWEKGIFKYDGKKITNYGIKEGLNTTSFWTCMTDREGNVWFGAWGDGLYKFSGEAFTKVTERSGIESNNIVSIAEDSTGIIWITNENCINRFDPKTNTIQKIDQLNGKPLNKITCTVIDKNNNLLALGYGSNGYKVHSMSITTEAWIGGLSAIRDKNGVLYFGAENRGIRKIRDDGTFTEHGTNERVGINSIEGIYLGKNGDLWLLNLTSGINRYDGNKVFFFNRDKGFMNYAATAIAEDDDGCFWAGTNGKGLYKFKLLNTKNFQLLDSISSSNGLSSDIINSIHFVNNKMLIGTAFGLSEMDMTTYKKGNVSIRTYNKEEGLANTNCSVSMIDKEGKVWIRTPRGAYIYQPKLSRSNPVESKNYISSVKLFFEPTDWAEKNFALDNNGLPIDLNLPYDQNHLTFNFIGICQTAPTKVLYQYKIEGLDKDWSPIANKTEVTYPSLPPGTYRFLLKSCNNEGVWNKTPTYFMFTIEPPFWKRNWFYVLVFLLGVTIIYFYTQFREKKLTAEKLILENKVNERTQELKGALEQIEEKQTEIVDSIKYAKRIQSAYLPPEEVFYNVFKNSFLLFKPKDIVSGDFYWFYGGSVDPKSGRVLMCAVADCTGHGVPGALMSVICCNALNEVVVKNKVTDTGNILNETRKLVKQSLKSTAYSGQKDGMDIAFIKLDTNTNELWYSGAYNPLWVVKNGELVELKADKQPIGIYENEKDFKVNHLQLSSGDVIYLFSDGYADQFGGAKGKKFKYKALGEVILNNYQTPMLEQKKLLNEAFESWRGDLEQVDDVCIIGIRL